MSTEPTSLTTEKIRRLEEENKQLRKELSLSYGHEDTDVSFQETVLVDRFLPDMAAVTFRLGSPETPSRQRPRVICQLYEGNLEMITMGSSVRIKKTESNRVLLIEEKGDPLNEFL